MKRPATLVLLVLVGAGSVSSTAWAQPHQPEDSGGEITPTPPQDVWLRRLVGSFKYEGMVSAGDCSGFHPACGNLKGKSNCIAVGSGPGVQCVLNVTWPEDIVMLPYLDPAMDLYGRDPGKSAINYLNVNNKGLPEGGLGTVKGNMAKFRIPCVNASAGCFRIIVIEAKPEARILFMWLYVERVPNAPMLYATTALRRVLQEEAGTVPAGNSPPQDSIMLRR